MSAPPIVLLSAGQSAPPDEAAPPALLPLFGSSLIGWQARALMRHGFPRFAIAVSHMPALLVAEIDRLRAQGAVVDPVRSVRELAALTAHGADLLVMAEGLWCSDAMLDTLLRQFGAGVFVSEEAPHFAAFERIDLTTRWAGVARIGSATLAGLADIPADWSLESTLMREALREGAPRHRVALAGMPEPALALITDAASAQQIERMAAAAVPEQAEDGLIERLLFAPAARSLLPLGWSSAAMQRPGALALLAIAPVAIALLALACAVLRWPVVAGLLALLALFAASCERRLEALRSAAGNVWLWPRAPLALLAAALPFWLAGGQARWWPMLPAAVALVAILALTGLAEPLEKWQKVKPGLADFAAIMTVGAALVSPVAGGWAAALLALGLLLADRLHRRGAMPQSDMKTGA